MKVLKSYGSGIKEATLQPKMIFILWLRNFIFGLALFYVFFRFLTWSIGNSVLADSLLERFDFSVFFEILVHHDEAMNLLLMVGFVLILLYFLVSVFLYGGILSILTLPPEAKEERRRLAQTFFQGAGKFFGRFFRLSIYALLLWVAFFLINLLLNPLGKLLTGNGSNEWMGFYFFWIRVAIGLFLVFLIRMILDYSRIEIVILDSQAVFLSFLKTIKLVFQQFGKTLALYYLLVLTGIIVIIVFWVANSNLPSFSSTWMTVFIPFLVAQLFIAFQGWLKIAFQSAQLVFYLSLSAI
ncbi:MAG: hypothetical protein GTO17_02710 [Candidatus Aminicenantes bacterium]|nr:hypothetical protein [Candidatus Aminicenantes bacterium]